MFALTAALLLTPTTAHAAPAQGPQLSFHGGLLQPLLLDGFNAAVDYRQGRFVAVGSSTEV